LQWFNGVFIRQMPLEDLTEKIIPYLQKSNLIEELQDKKFKTKNGKVVSRNFISSAVALEQERLKKMDEIGERVKYFFESPLYRPEILIWRKSDLSKTRNALKLLINFLENIDETIFLDQKKLEENTKDFISKNGFDNGSVLWPLRVALSGLEASPGPFEIMTVLYKEYGKFEVLSRLENAIKILE